MEESPQHTKKNERKGVADVHGGPLPRLVASPAAYGLSSGHVPAVLGPVPSGEHSVPGSACLPLLCRAVRAVDGRGGPRAPLCTCSFSLARRKAGVTLLLPLYAR